MKNYFTIFAIVSLIFTLPSCTSGNGKTDGSRTVFTGEAGEVCLIVLAPGHFHASLLQKSPMRQTC